MQTIECGSNISSFVEVLKFHFGGFREIWFRGQSKSDYELIPSLFRQGVEYGCKFNEAAMYEEFVRRHPEQEESHKNVLDWLTLMQHYNIPTRLLDWTSNLLVAIYFACNEPLGQDGAIFAFDPASLSWYKPTPLFDMQVTAATSAEFYEHLILRNGGLLDDASSINGVSLRDIKSEPLSHRQFLDRSVTVNNRLKSVQIKQNSLNMFRVGSNETQPEYEEIVTFFSNIVLMRHAHLNSRIKQQSGFFTLHGGKFFNGNAFIEPDKFEEHHSFQALGAVDLLKIVVKSRNKRSLVEELDISGVRESTLFPEMEYQAKHIRAKDSENMNVAQN